MPGPCFSWAKSMSFKARSITFKSDPGSEISYESRTGSFSSTPLRSDGHPPKTPPRRHHGCTQGCTPSISNLKEMLQGGSTHSRSSSSSTTSMSPSEDPASRMSKKSWSFRKQQSFNERELYNVQPAATVPKAKSGSLCLVKGCRECRDPTHHHAGGLSPKCVCSKCGETFLKADALELHLVVRHAVSELERGNSSLNVIEIIFKTSWIPAKQGLPIARVERILKIDNTERHISEFHRYRDMVRKAASDEGMQHERCLADGNELLRFYGSSFTCSLGSNGSTNLCSMTTCNVCSIIRWGFEVRKERGIYTTATSGRAHEVIANEEKENWTGKHAMLVCRVIAGRIYRTTSASTTSRFNDPSCLPFGYDSISPGASTNLDHLTVFNPKAVLPCFLVVYRL